MANELTGDYDVVAQFTLGAANRVLAAMHCGGRMPHSWSLRVDDYTHLHLAPGTTPSSVVLHSVVDAFGGPVTDPMRVSKARRAPSAPPSSPINLNFDSPVNALEPVSALTAGGRRPPARPTVAVSRAGHLIGVAQLQMGAPTIELTGGSDVAV